MLERLSHRSRRFGAFIRKKREEQSKYGSMTGAPRNWRTVCALVAHD